ncbi:MAG: Ca-activated chloride channel [Acidobacteriota bacterium]|jgi:VWFA-related protein
MPHGRLEDVTAAHRVIRLAHRAQPCAAVMALCMTVAGAAQSPPTRAPRTLRSSVEVTAVTVTVRNADGRLAPDLPREAFSVYEDGEPQAITQFTHERVPVALGLLLDVSDSMFGSRIRDARAAVARFLLELLAPDDVFFLMAFNHSPHVLTPWTSDPDVVRTALEALHPSGGTAIYDAVLKALPLVESRPRDRAALVLISDGADTASDVTLRELRAALLKTDAFIYAIAIDSQAHQAINTRVNPEALAEITTQSGGRTEVVHDTADLGPATARIAEELNSQYVLGYSSPRPGDGKYHAIRVTVAPPGYKVRARNGYVAARRS